MNGMGFRKLGEMRLSQGLTALRRLGKSSVAPGDTTAPTAPTGLSATPVSTSQINLAWTDASSDEVGFRVYRSTDGVTYAQIGTDLATGTQAYSDTPVTAGQKYYYKVGVFDVAGNEAQTSAVSANTLTLNLANYWKLNETSDGSAPVTRNDSVGVLHMSDINTTPSTTGILGNAPQFTIASSEHLRNTAFGGLGNFDFTFCGWYYRDAAVPNQSVLGSSSGAFWIREGAGSNNYIVRMNDGSDHEVVRQGGATGIWNFFVAWYDATNDLEWFQINNGTAASVANTGGVTAGAFTLYIGAHVGPGSYFGGRIDEVGYWTRILTAAERTALYNSGAGFTHPF